MNAFLEYPRISIILPVYNEAECLPAVLDEVRDVSRIFPECEIIVSDDGSTDETPGIVKEKAVHDPRVRLLRNPVNCGQSAALYLAFQEATGEIIVTLDGDGQNDPRDIPLLVAPLLKTEDGLIEPADLCCGYRTVRRDTRARRIASRMANSLRRFLLHDGINDTGCSLKAFRARFVQRLSYWHGMHRFLPMLCAAQGAVIVQIPVRHHARLAGTSKYTNLGRLKTTWADLLGVRWMLARTRAWPAIAACLDAPERHR